MRQMERYLCGPGATLPRLHATHPALFVSLEARPLPQHVEDDDDRERAGIRSDPGPRPSTSRHALGRPPERGPGLAVTPPRELGVMLVSAGLIGAVLPGPGVPALVVGGLILWPKGFGKAEQWLRRRFPEAHRKGIGHINRFLTDLERRYPGSTGARRGSGPSGCPRCRTAADLMTGHISDPTLSTSIGAPLAILGPLSRPAP